MKNLLFSALLALCLCFLSAPANAATFVVNVPYDSLDATNGDGVCADAQGDCSLRAAVSESNNLPGADVILLPAGYYLLTRTGMPNENGNLTGDLDIVSDITITGDDANTTFIEPGGLSDRIFDMGNTAASVTIENVTIRYGRASSSNGMHGGGIRNIGGPLTLNAVLVLSNRALGGNGGGIYNEGRLTINNSGIGSNSCTGSGGGGGVPAGVCFGGGIFHRPRHNGTMTIYHTGIGDNEANFTHLTGSLGHGYGAGLAIHGYGPNTSSLNEVSFVRNRAGAQGSMGGGFYLRSDNGLASTAITTSYLIENLFSQGDGMMGAGAALHTMPNGTISANWSNMHFQSNDVPYAPYSWPLSGAIGGGLAVRPTGGAITMNLSQSSIFDNRAKRGGGIAFTNVGGTPLSTATLTATNVSIGRNYAEGSGSSVGYGGGVYLERPVAASAPVNITFDHSTIMENTGFGGPMPNGGGGIYHTSNHVNLFVYLKNSIVSNNKWNSQNNDLRGNFISQNYNHFGTPAAAIISGTTANNTTGQLYLYTLDQSGFTWYYTHPPFAPPIVNAIPIGVNGCGTGIIVDQIGTTRPQFNGCDKGSIEVP